MVGTVKVHANPVVKPEPIIPGPGVPSQVRSSTLPTPEETIVKTIDKSVFRRRVESTTSEVKEEPKVEAPELVVTEPEVIGTIVVTLFKNRPYEVEFSGNFTGAERDLAVRFLQRRYSEWKHNQAKANDARIKADAKVEAEAKDKEGGK